MDVRFDKKPHKISNPQTRIYSPTQTGDPTPVLEDTSMPIRPQPRKEARVETNVRTEIRLSTSSKVLILLAVFVIAATALFALFGAAQYARVISETGAVNTEIETYNEQISQLRKSQSSMNDFATINEVCRSRGMTMNWYRGETDLGTASAMPQTSPAEGTPAAQQTPAPETPAPGTPEADTPEPEGD